MAFTKSLEPVVGTGGKRHSQVDGGYQIVQSEEHGTVVQIDTYESDERKLRAKTSQSDQSIENMLSSS